MEKRQRLAKKKKDALERWTIDDSAELYGIDHWGANLFGINKQGHAVMFGRGTSPDIDLKQLINDIRAHGLKTPVLIRFTDILKSRLKEIHSAFMSAFKENSYNGAYLGVYPIKVNQHRHILEDITSFGKEFNFGLEAGSKPELLLAIAHQTNPEAVIVCNGFKDRDYIEAALRARQIGHKIFIVIERPAEVGLVLDISRKMKVEPLLGVRMKLASKGKGMWESSGGARSKFGLDAGQIVEAIQTLKRRKMLHTLQLLHFHIGSQITDIQRVKQALREATALFAEIRALGAPINFLDVGGGLAVDYDGSHTNFTSSANYGVTEYASDVVSSIFNVCDETGLPHPAIITECGRAMTAHHSMLVIEAVATAGIEKQLVVPKVPPKAPEVLTRIQESYEDLTPKNFQEIYHDAVEARKEAMTLFNLRHLSLTDRAKVEDFFWIICRRIAKYVKKLDYTPEEYEAISGLASAIYYCNFSLFQSLTDHWAIKQLFPVMPLQRLDEKPENAAILADITCDSDGVIDQFVDLRDVKESLPLHSLKPNERYDIGIFLVGAYQAILGDLHNLFGDTTVVHVSTNEKGYLIDRTIEGNSIGDVLGFVEFDPETVMVHLREQIESALSADRISAEDATEFMRHTRAMLEGHTYLNEIEAQG